MNNKKKRRTDGKATCYKSLISFVIPLILFLTLVMACNPPEETMDIETLPAVGTEVPPEGSIPGPLPITKDMKCPTCGMRTYEFTNWHTQIIYKDGTSDSFCAVKCLMAYYFEPEKYGDRSKDDFETPYAMDYYTLEWYDMKEMSFVIGSDVLGPMGNDLVPFKDYASAETFLNDHFGSEILDFDGITLELISRLRMKKDKGL